MDEGDLRLIGPATEARDLVKVSLAAGSRSASVSADQSVRRLISIRLSGWERAATVVSRCEAARFLKLEENRYSRAGTASPSAIIDEAGKVTVTPATGITVVSALAIVDPGPDNYVLDERALDTIPSIFTP